MFSILQRPAPYVLLVIPDHTLDGGRAGFIVFPLLTRKPRTRERRRASGAQHPNRI